MAKSRRETVWFPIVLRELEVLHINDVTPTTRRITLGGPELGEFHRYGHDLPAFRTDGFDDHMKLFFTAPGDDAPVLPVQTPGNIEWPSDPRPISKDYTPRRFDAVAGELDVDFVRHGTGHASSWAERARPGDTVFIAGPKTSAKVPADVDWHLIAGDETALPAIGRFLEELPAGAQAVVIVEVDGPDSEQKIDTAATIELTWLHRNGAAPGTTDLLERAVRDVEWREGTVFAWVAGEALTLKPIRRHLRDERSVPRDLLDVTGYWRRSAVAEAPRVSATEAADARLHDLTEILPPYAVRIAATLRLPDLVGRGLTKPPELATATGTDTRALGRLLRYLVTVDVLTEPAPGVFGVGELGELITDDSHAHGQLDLSTAHARLELAVAGLADSVRTGEAGYASVFGRTFRQDLANDPNLARSRAEQSWDFSDRWAPNVVRVPVWSGAEHVVGIGDTGRFGTYLLGAFPGIHLTLADQPTPLAHVRRALDGQTPPGGVTFAEQSPFEPWPDGDTYVVTRLVHEWPEAEAVRVLNRAAEAADGGGTVHLLERVFDPENYDEHDAEADLVMLSAFGSGERTAQEYAELADAAGLSIRHIRPVGWGLSMLELGR